MISFDLSKLSKLQKKLRRQILTVSHHRQLSHLGSCLSSVDIITAIYQVKNQPDEFILSNGHAAMAWYVVLKHFQLLKANSDSDWSALCIHPNRLENQNVSVSTGSLGHGLPISLGMALAEPDKKIFCLTSDGELTEGSMWESLRIQVELGVTNLITLVNANGWAAYREVDINMIKKQLQGFGLQVLTVDGHHLPKLRAKLQRAMKMSKPTVVFCLTEVEQFPCLNGQDAHYHVMTDQEFKQGLTLL